MARRVARRTVTSLLFAIGKLLIGLYLGNSSTASAYGAAGSFVVLLVWIYYSAQICCSVRIQGLRPHAWLEGGAEREHREPARKDRVGIPRKEQVEAGGDADRQPQAYGRAAATDTNACCRACTMPSSNIGTVVLGICVALATFIVGMQWQRRSLLEKRQPAARRRMTLKAASEVGSVNVVLAATRSACRQNGLCWTKRSSPSAPLLLNALCLTPIGKSGVPKIISGRLMASQCRH